MLNLLFPKVCCGCSSILVKSETTLCSDCRHELPLVNFHHDDESQMKRIFYGRLLLENATALFRFQKKGITQQIMHNLKYRGQASISSFFGKWLGAELAEIPAYRQIDMVIPVPLHRSKLLKRGYNQVEGFGKELARSLNCPYRDDVLTKVSKTGTQVFSKRLMRFGNKEEVFQLTNSEELIDKHLLLVDDIVTTGATLEKCSDQLLTQKGVKLSVATMAIA